MLLNSKFQAFIQQRPICVMARGILERLFDAKRLDVLFDSYADLGYTRHLHFSTVVDLMADVVLGVKPSVNAAFQALDQRPDGVSIASVYNKLANIETTVSAAFVHDSFTQSAPAIDALDARLPPWLPGFRCRLLDGNHLSATEHRLDPLRTIWDAPLPGKALVVMDPERALAECVFLTEDGHCQERSLLGDVLEHVQPNDVWIADRGFCTLRFLLGIANRQGFFVIRRHGTMPGTLIGKPRRVGKCATGLVFEQKLIINDPDTGEPSEIRQITIRLTKPTRGGDRELRILTNLTEDQADALCVANLYAKRWTIETMFQEVTMTLQCEIKTLAYPKAALFAFSLALTAYNAVSILKASLRAVHGAEKVTKAVSGYYLALEIRGVYEGMMIAIPEKHWAAFGTMGLTEFVETLKDIASHVKLERYRKHPRGPKKPPTKRTRYHNGGHASTYRLLNEDK